MVAGLCTCCVVLRGFLLLFGSTGARYKTYSETLAFGYIYDDACDHPYNMQAFALVCFVRGCFFCLGVFCAYVFLGCLDDGDISLAVTRVFLSATIGKYKTMYI